MEILISLLVIIIIISFITSRPKDSEPSLPEKIASYLKKHDNESITLAIDFAESMQDEADKKRAYIQIINILILRYNDYAQAMSISLEVKPSKLMNDLAFQVIRQGLLGGMYMNVFEVTQTIPNKEARTSFNNIIVGDVIDKAIRDKDNTKLKHFYESVNQNSDISNQAKTLMKGRLAVNPSIPKENSSKRMRIPMLTDKQEHDRQVSEWAGQAHDPAYCLDYWDIDEIEEYAADMGISPLDLL